jgi:hypothetical protein
MTSENTSVEQEMKKKEMDQLMNIEFLNFKNDIFKIVQQAKEQDNNKNLKKRPQTSYPIKKDAEKNNDIKSINDDLNNINKINNSDLSKETIGEMSKYSSSRSQTSKKLAPIKKQKPKKVNYLRQTLQKDLLEEDMIKLTIEKRDKEFQRECVRKMVLANDYAEVLKIPKSYSAYCEEGDSTILCRVYDKNTKNFEDVNLKQFLIEFKKLQKLINQEKEREKYKEQKIEVVKVSNNKNETDFFKMNREQKHKVIKQILKESLELKIQLKKQLKALRDKNLIDNDTISKNLKLTNLDDDSIL